MEVQEVASLVRNPLMAKGILGIRRVWVHAQTHGGAESTPLIRNPLGFEGCT